MPTIQIDLDVSAFNKLAGIAVEQRRPIPWQAEILLLKALAAWPGPLADAVPPSRGLDLHERRSD